ncbi:uncharacterized protein FMAN_14280 [Fusarium mangiferae]|uniref:Uncharacterized protein n=1 Tax=Fusarium mangiferae TaxID=192010 RepID=A0A1L7UE95_FUSMA|nr:uncharacterized protein FMAN_14280 [Fusarium mangiferae]CVL09000.1 uncharacterized protein FMAN_14280 [Fusarium mangiferae]
MAAINDDTSQADHTEEAAMAARVCLFWAARDGFMTGDDRKQKTDAPRC